MMMSIFIYQNMSLKRVTSFFPKGFYASNKRRDELVKNETILLERESRLFLSVTGSLMIEKFPRCDKLQR